MHQLKSNPTASNSNVLISWGGHFNLCLTALKAPDLALEEKKKCRFVVEVWSPRTTTKGLLLHLLHIPACGTPGKAKRGAFEIIYEEKKKGFVMPHQRGARKVEVINKGRASEQLP